MSEINYEKLWYQSNKELSAKDEEIKRLKGIEKDHIDDWKRIQDAERKCEQLESLITGLQLGADSLRKENDQLKKENTNLEHTCERRYEVLMAENQAGQLIETKLKTQAEIIEKIESALKFYLNPESIEPFLKEEQKNKVFGRPMIMSGFYKSAKETLASVAELKKGL